MGDRRDADTRPQTDVSGRRTKPDTTERKPRNETGAGFWGLVEKTTGLAVGDSPKRPRN